MSAERGAQIIDEKLLIWGGDGEREDPPADPPEGDPKDEEDAPGVDGEDPDNDPDKEQGDKEDDKKGEKTLEEQLDEEKAARLKAERKLRNQEKAAEDAKANKDVVKDRDRYKQKLEARDKFLTDNLIIMEINKQKKYDFVDVDDVIRVFKGDEVHVDLDADEPTVEGLDLALKRIAKDKPHFLKKAKEDEQELPPSGDKGGTGGVGSDKTREQELGKKYKIPGYGNQAQKMM